MCVISIAEFVKQLLLLVVADNAFVGVSKYTDDSELIERAIMQDGVDKILLQSALDKMKAEYGSVKGYLQTRLGLSEEDFAKLKEIYLEP
ncbi:MAG: tyrosine-protein phosphatase [Firmicutes bacterium]|nr:tyrosine-protein phosphatase [Bacillota bacterium]